MVLVVVELAFLVVGLVLPCWQPERTSLGGSIVARRSIGVVTADAQWHSSPKDGHGERNVQLL